MVSKLISGNLTVGLGTTTAHVNEPAFTVGDGLTKAVVTVNGKVQVTYDASNQGAQVFGADLSASGSTIDIVIGVAGEWRSTSNIASGGYSAIHSSAGTVNSTNHGTFTATGGNIWGFTPDQQQRPDLRPDLGHER